MRQVLPGTPYPARKCHGGTANGGRGWMLFSLLLMGMFTAFVAFPTFVILACGLPPAIVSGLIDGRGGGRNMFACILATNLCGVAPAVVNLWSTGNTIAAAMALLADPYVWLVMYGAAAIGWGLLWALPEIAVIALTLIDNERIRKLRSYQRKLVTEWGQGVAGASEATSSKTGSARKARA